MSWPQLRILNRVCGSVESAGGVLVGCDMVRMAVATGFVEGNEHLGAELANDFDDFAHHLSGVGLGQ